MLDFLKKKISSLFAKEKEEKVEKKEKRKKPVKKEKAIKEQKKSNKTKSEIKIDAEVESIIKEAEPEQEKQEEKESGNFFTKLLKKMSTSQLSQDDFNDAFQDMEIALLENNVALEAVDAIKESLSNQLVGQQMKKSNASAYILESLKNAILSVLQDSPDLINAIKSSKEPYVILFFGINGTGKTTSIAKLAYQLKKEGISSVLGAADTFRAASIEQLDIHAKKIGVPMVSSKYGSDPASVAFDTIQYAKKHHLKAALIDTAGRMYTKANLMKEMEKIIRISKPNLKLFVGESITGNDVIDQVKTFNDSVGIDGIILTKADIDEKAGTILSVSHVTKKPIYFLGTGQEYKDLTQFTKKTVLKHLGLE